jgi:carbamoyl-phosphate synthase small subunit
MATVGIIAGGGRLPFVAAVEARARGYRVVGVAIRGEADPSLADQVDVLHWVQLGQLGAVVRSLRSEGASEALMLGKVEITHVNLNDQTLEGLRHRELPIFSVQYHPEASPGPHDAQNLFEEFVAMMKPSAR